MELEKERQIEEDYCSFELSKLLKEKGLDTEFVFFYRTDEEGKYIHHANTLQPISYKIADDEVVAAITHQMAMKWLREKKNIYIQIRFSGLIVPVTKYVVDILDAEGNWIDNNLEERTYYDIVESTLKFCLSRLVKNNRG